MKIMITGGAGFIGSNLVGRLMASGENEIMVYDNLSLGKKKYIKQFLKHKNFRFIQADLIDLERLKKEMVGVSLVYHLAANSDIREGTKNTQLDITTNTLVTFNVLEAMRINNVRDIIFTSTSAIYGEVDGKISENYGPMKPQSLYGASKLACEAFISAFCHSFGMRAIIFRFANVAGRNSTHGVIYDFISQLKKHPKHLDFLSDGTPCKPYIEVNDLIDGIFYCMFALSTAPPGVSIFNIGPDDKITVREIADIISRYMHLKPKYNLQQRPIGWVGDINTYGFDNSKLKALGWEPKCTSRQAVEQAVSDLCRQ